MFDFDLIYVLGWQGVPVVKSTETLRASRDDCHFGTKCFQDVTKVKSRTVLHLLQLGFKVLFSDVDVYWFQVRHCYRPPFLDHFTLAVSITFRFLFSFFPLSDLTCCRDSY